MTSAGDRRLAKLERALPPMEAVLAWLVEAQQFPSFEDHVRAITQLPVEAAPLSVIGDRVEAAVRGSMKSQPRDEVTEAVRRAVGDGAFLFSLVLQINSQAFEIAKVEGLRASAVFYWMGTLLGGPRADDLPPAEARTYVRELADAWALWRAVVDRLRLDVRVENEARAALSRRFFGGHDLFFADIGEAWTAHVNFVERLSGLADNLTAVGTRKRRRATGDLRGMVDVGVAERVARLADDARVRAYEIMGDRPRAVAIMERRLRAEGRSKAAGTRAIGHESSSRQEL